MKCGGEYPSLGAKAHPIALYLKLVNVFPCVPQEQLLRQHAKAFKIDELTSASLVEAVLPASIPSGLAESGGITQGIMETLRNSTAFKRPPVPRDNTKDALLKKKEPIDLMADKAGPLSKISVMKTVRGPQCSSSEETELLIGYETGAVALYNLKRYGAYLDTQRFHTSWAKALGMSSAENGPSMDRSQQQFPDGIDLLGYHASGRVMCAVYDRRRSVALTGSVDGSIYIWDVQNLYSRNNSEKKEEEEKKNACPSPIQMSATEEFAEAVRSRRLCSIRKNAHCGPLSAIAVYLDAVITGGAEGAVKIWGYKKKCTDSPQLYQRQTFAMQGWVRSIHAAPTRGVQTEDVIITDDTGSMMGLKADAISAESDHNTGGEAPQKQSGVPPDTCDKFYVTRTHQTMSEEKKRLRGHSTAQDKECATNTIVVLTPVRSNSLLMCLNYSPIVRFFDQSQMRIVHKLTHPTLTGDGSDLAMKEISSVYRKEASQRQSVFHEPKPPPTNQTSFAPSPSQQMLATSTDVNPLRFISTLYVPSTDVVLLLDSRNTIFVWELSSNTFLAKTSIPEMTGRNGSIKRRATLLLPYGLDHYSESKQGGGRRSIMENLDEHFDVIPFFAVCDTGVELYNLVKTAKPVVEVPAHQEPVTGLQFRPCSMPPPVHCVSSEREVALLSISMEGSLLCWADQLQFIRAYKNGEPSSTSQWVSENEVTSFFYHEQWDFAITGHSNGDLRYWFLTGELTDFLHVEGAHTNTISSLCGALVPPHSGAPLDKWEEVLATTGYDGFLATWSYSKFKGPKPRLKERITYNELNNVVFLKQKNMFIVSDSGGQIFCLSSMDLSRTRAYLVQNIVCNVSMQSARPSPHTGSITCVCLLNKTFVTCDDQGCVMQWDACTYAPTGTELKLYPESEHDLLSVSRAAFREITQAVKVVKESFIATTRSGHVHFFDASASFTAVGVYSHVCEVTSIAVNEASIHGPFFEFVVGDADGAISSLSSAIFSTM